jgi:hypothetical protein
MRTFFVGVVLSLFTFGSAVAQQTCDAKAVGQDGKALAGVAKASFVKKCKTDACEPKAVDKNGKPLARAAKASFMKNCAEGA